jgi:Phage tail assembly chaperone protein
MSEIRIRKTGETMSVEAWKAEFPSTSFPEQLTENTLNSMGADFVHEGTKPQLTSPYQYTFRDGVENINGRWYTKYSIGPVFVDSGNNSALEKEMSYRNSKDMEQGLAVRNHRDTLLTKSDWTQLEDSVVDKPRWATYRQALRDISKQDGFPWGVVWPSEPI